MELPSLSRHTAILQTGLWMTSLLKVTPLPLRSVMRRSRSSTSNAIVPPAGSLGFSLVKLVRAKQPAARQVVFHPPVVPLVPGRARLEAERLLVELARPRHVGDRVIREGDFLEHRTPFLSCAARSAASAHYVSRGGSRVRCTMAWISLGARAAAPNSSELPAPLAARADTALASRIGFPVSRRAAAR
jgi:hypothetical protein